MFATVLEQLIRKQHLDRGLARQVMGAIMDGEATPAQIGAFLAALRAKGEHAGEIVGFVQAMRERALRVSLPVDNLVDACGTGGDGLHTFNISTAASIVAASGGARVTKHGNRAVSSRSGSADVLEALGIPISMSPSEAAACLMATNLCFLFAPLYHKAMKHAAGPRKELAIRTVFNLLGPLTNPAGAKRQLLGIYDASLLTVVAEVLKELGAERALVVAGEDGMDEMTVTGTTRVAELRDGRIVEYEVTPESFGLGRHPLEQVRGGDAKENAAIIERVLAGERGAARDIVLLNAGAILYLADRAATLGDGVIRAAELIDRGDAARKLEQIREVAGAMSHAT